MLANYLGKVMQQLVHPDQSGFIATRSTAANTCRLFHNQQLPSDNIDNRVILLLITAKLFDSVEGPYLWEVLHCFGLGDRFIG